MRKRRCSLEINVGINIPTSSGLNANLRANFVSERKLYSQNPLRAQGETIDAYVQINGALSWSQEPFGITLKVTNLLASDHFHPGVEQADSGNDFSQRSLGFRNSLVPQPGRSVALRLSMQY